jgi:hypothetical protein
MELWNVSYLPSFKMDSKLERVIAELFAFALFGAELSTLEDNDF